MPETDEAATQTEPQSEDVSAKPSQEVDEPTESTQFTDWKAEARKWEKRAKENSDAAAELAKLKEAAAGKDTELDTLKAELDTLKAERARADLIQATAAAAHVDTAILARMSGETAEEIESNAEALKKAMDAQSKYPDVSDKGEERVVAASTADQFASALDQIISN